MALPPYCPTPEAVLLLGLRDERGVFRFPVQDEATPGIVIAAEPRLPIGPQLIAAAQKILGEHISVEILSDHFFPNVAELPRSLYLATARSNDDNAIPTRTMDQILRGLGQGPLRLVYFKTLQIFAGAHKEVIKAIESKDLQ